MHSLAVRRTFIAHYCFFQLLATAACLSLMLSGCLGELHSDTLQPQEQRRQQQQHHGGNRRGHLLRAACAACAIVCATVAATIAALSISGAASASNNSE